MKILYSYLKNYRGLVLLALFLAAVNQVFSLLDPYIFRLIIDGYATKFEQYDLEHFIKGVSWLLFLAISVAFISRVAKNFQDYYINNITQRPVSYTHLDVYKRQLFFLSVNSFCKSEIHWYYSQRIECNKHRYKCEKKGFEIHFIFRITLSIYH